MYHKNENATYVKPNLWTGISNSYFLEEFFLVQCWGSLSEKWTYLIKTNIHQRITDPRNFNIDMEFLNDHKYTQIYFNNEKSSHVMAQKLRHLTCCTLQIILLNDTSSLSQSRHFLPFNSTNIGSFYTILHQDITSRRILSWSESSLQPKHTPPLKKWEVTISPERQDWM